MPTERLEEVKGKRMINVAFSCNLYGLASIIVCFNVCQCVIFVLECQHGKCHRHALTSYVFVAQVSVITVLVQPLT